jgi:hypothetical protein
MISNADQPQRHFIAAVRRPGSSSLDVTGRAVCGDFVDRSTR